ncbi:MAG: hypothetical protein JWN66_2409 [Sphingomonas bacterium]|nr:hypothetical protein [Sphingomonas bacterium]
MNRGVAFLHGARAPYSAATTAISISRPGQASSTSHTVALAGAPDVPSHSIQAAFSSAKSLVFLSQIYALSSFDRSVPTRSSSESILAKIARAWSATGAPGRSIATWPDKYATPLCTTACDIRAVVACLSIVKNCLRILLSRAGNPRFGRAQI